MRRIVGYNRVMLPMFCMLIFLYGCGVRTDETANVKDESIQSASGTVNTDALKVRKEPVPDAEVSALLQKDQQVTILLEENGFYKISFDSDTGYVKTEYVDIEQSE